MSAETYLTGFEPIRGTEDHKDGAAKPTPTPPQSVFFQAVCARLGLHDKESEECAIEMVHDDRRWLGYVKAFNDATQKIDKAVSDTAVEEGARLLGDAISHAGFHHTVKTVFGSRGLLRRDKKIVNDRHAEWLAQARDSNALTEREHTAEAIKTADHCLYRDVLRRELGTYRNAGEIQEYEAAYVRQQHSKFVEIHPNQSWYDGQTSPESVARAFQQGQHHVAQQQHASKTAQFCLGHRAFCARVTEALAALRNQHPMLAISLFSNVKPQDCDISLEEYRKMLNTRKLFGNKEAPFAKAAAERILERRLAKHKHKDQVGKPQTGRA